MRTIFAVSRRRASRRIVLAKVGVASSSLVSRSNRMPGETPRCGVFALRPGSEPRWRPVPRPGWVAEWLCSGLQSRLRRFDSGPSLHRFRWVSRASIGIVPILNTFVADAARLPDRNPLQPTNDRARNPFRRSFGAASDTRCARPSPTRDATFRAIGPSGSR